jgi:hypothetical protein
MATKNGRQAATLEDWREMAAQLRDASRMLNDLHDRLCRTAGVGIGKAEPLRRAIHQLQRVKAGLDTLAIAQAGEEAASLFYGPQWVCLA